MLSILLWNARLVHSQMGEWYNHLRIIRRCEGMVT